VVIVKVGGNGNINGGGIGIFNNQITNTFKNKLLLLIIYLVEQSPKPKIAYNAEAREIRIKELFAHRQSLYSSLH